MKVSIEPPQEGAVNSARDFLAKVVASYGPPVGDEDPRIGAEEILEAFDSFVADYVRLLELVFDGSLGENLRLAFVRGLLSEILESIIKISGAEMEEVRPFILAGRIVGSISPERAQELLKSLGYGLGDVPEMIN